MGPSTNTISKVHQQMIRAHGLHSFKAKEVFSGLSGQRFKALAASGLVRMNGKPGKLEWVGGTPQPIHARRVIEAGNALQKAERVRRYGKKATPAPKAVKPKKAKAPKVVTKVITKRPIAPPVQRREVSILWGLFKMKL